jgi:hypothetical protein
LTPFFISFPTLESLYAALAIFAASFLVTSFDKNVLMGDNDITFLYAFREAHSMGNLFKISRESVLHSGCLAICSA